MISSGDHDVPLVITDPVRHGEAAEKRLMNTLHLGIHVPLFVG